VDFLVNLETVKIREIRGIGVLVFWTLVGLIILAVSACAPLPTETPLPPFNPPTPAANPTEAATSVPTEPLPTPTQACNNDLTFIEDVTIPDGTTADPGTELDKRWLIRNDGTCNWDADYGLVLVTGDSMGAASPQPLFPARAGAEAELRILFTAPDTPGIYRSAWQPVSPEGAFFGDSVFIEIVVP
jgi:hypothetical protein